MNEFSARWDEGKGRAKDNLLGRWDSSVLSAPPPPNLEEWRLWRREEALAGDKESAFGQVFEVRQDTCT